MTKKKIFIGVALTLAVVIQGVEVGQAATKLPHFSTVKALEAKYSTGVRLKCKSPMTQVVDVPVGTKNFMCEDGTLGYWYKSSAVMKPYLALAIKHLDLFYGVIYGDNWYVFTSDPNVQGPRILRTLGGKAHYNYGK